MATEALRVLCSQANFRIWNGTAFDYCFKDVFIEMPFHALFAAISAYFIAFVSLARISSQASKRGADVCRLLLSIAELVAVIFQYLSALNHNSLHSMLSMVTQIFAWSTHVIYLLQCIRTRNNFAEKRSVTFFMAVLLVFISDAVSLQSSISGGYVELSNKLVWIPILKASLTLLYIIVFVVDIYRSSFVHFVTSVTEQTENGQEDELLHMSSSFHEEMGEENANVLSKVTFWWVNELMRRGVKSMLKSPSDLFTLPVQLSADVVNKNVDKIKMKLRSEQPFKLWKLLFASFGAKFALIGILKFIADILGFAGPLLLNQIILYLGNKNKNKHDLNGFYFAAGLFLSSLISSFSITLFNYHITNATLNVKSTLISLIYQKMFKVRSHSLLNAFSIGEVLNFSSTDTDRISSFCPNLLQLFSLPIQLAISLCLLYTQLGLSFVSGLMFAVIILPINKWICDKIGDLSTKMMKFKDKRIRLMTEILSGVRIIKMHAWEQFFSQRIDNYRKKEMKYMKGRKFLDAVCVYLWATTPVIISWLSFTTFILLDNKLTSAKVFTSLALFNMLIMPLNALPWVLNGVVEAWVSMKRIQKFLSMNEIIEEDHCNVQPSENVDIVAENAVFQREANETTNNSSLFCVGPLTLSVKRGAFIGVIGEVGSGKSSLLSAFVGEMLRIGGDFGVSRTELQKGVGLLPQEPFIINTTIRSNILFGKVYDMNLYNSVLNVCALHPDLQMLAKGENTLAGDKGAALSGGQKARVALARALYQQFNVYFFDDPFSSLDIHVAKHIYTHCIMEMLAQKTRILCTHHLEFLSEADVIYVMKDGKIVESGPPSVILESEVYRKLKETERTESKKCTEMNTSNEETENEEMNEGVVSWKVYKQYLKAGGWFLCVSILISFILMQSSRTFCDWWLAHWTSVIKYNGTTAENMNYLEYFAGFAGLNSVLTVIRAFLFAIGGIVAAISIHRLMLTSIFSCSAKFFDSKPFGRTITRFSSDLFNIDDGLPFTLNIFLAQIFSLLASIVITVYGIPTISILLLLLVIPYYYIQWFYRWTSRDLKRLCSITLAPIYSHFAETFYGLSTIRAFNSITRFTSELHGKVDDCNTTQYAANAASQWLNLRLQMLGVLVTGGVAFLAVSLHYFAIERVEAGFVGLALAYSLSITSLLNGVIQTFAQVETDMVSVERVQQYIDSSSKESTSGFSPISWPNRGVVIFDNVSMRYRENTPLVLQNVSFKVESNQFVGIVGRTGSGKSSLFQCLFRLIDPETGNITIDGIDTRTVQLKALRSNLFIIPQESFLFTGTLRENIDPSQSFSDAAIWKALRDCNLEAAILSLGGLGVNLNECGRDLSVGQKQLLCLTRALLSRKKIICLDEATASIDYKTEVVIYQTIRKYFVNSTVLMIAHKIESVLKCDKVIVMDASKVAEIGIPNELLSNKQSLLYKMFSSFEL